MGADAERYSLEPRPLYRLPETLLPGLIVTLFIYVYSAFMPANTPPRRKFSISAALDAPARGLFHRQRPASRAFNGREIN